MDRHSQEFIRKGPLNRVILTIAIPIMINNFVRTVFNLTDGIFVAWLSAEDFAATSFVWPLQFAFISLGLGTGIAATSLISRTIGSKHYKMSQDLASNTIFLLIVLGLLMSFIGHHVSPSILSWMGARDSFLFKSNVYLQISFVGLFFDYVFFAFQAILNAQGKTADITIISVISALVNIILDPIFIFDHIPIINKNVLGWGIAGAAWATVVSKAVLLVMAIVIVRIKSDIRIDFFKFRPKLSSVANIMSVSIPSSLGFGGSSIGFIIMNSVITSYGTNTLAAFSMGNRISDLFIQAQMGIGQGLTAIIGQNFGAKDLKRVRDIFKRAILLISILGFLSMLVIIIFRDGLIDLFIKGDSSLELRKLAKEYLLYSAFIVVFMGLHSGLNGYFQGIGRTKYSMAMDIARLWLLRLPMVWFFKNYTNLGSTAIWIAMLLSNSLTVLLGFIAYKNIKLENLVR